MTLAEFLSKIDFNLLSEQKLQLLTMIEYSTFDQDKEAMTGIINLIDHIQDSAVLIGYKAENEVFLLKEEVAPDPIDWTRKDNDVNGNPRYVCHFLNFITDKDTFTSLDSRYALALARAKNLGGRKYHNKQYGGGIIFQSYNTQALEQEIFKLMEQYK